MKPIHKAVFPVAGFGTRFLPATKAMPKELMPVIDKPLIQYAVEEAIEAGIDTLIFITGRNKRAIEDHFDSNPELERALIKKEKYSQAEMVRNILPKGIECIFIRQSEQLGLGHAVLCAERVVGNEPFAVLLADDFIICSNKGVTSQLVEGYETTGKSQLSVMTVADHDLNKYGVVKIGSKSNSVEGLIEKPLLKDAPSNLVSIGRYILTPDIFSTLRNQSTGVDGEIQLADAINTAAKNKSFESILLDGKRFDCGNIDGYLDAINHVSKDRQNK
jgi:UTP--glucose-1-phosphate uridylyltransferase